MKPDEIPKDAPIVKPKYRNLRDEIIESGHSSKADWFKFIHLK